MSIVPGRLVATLALGAVWVAWGQGVWESRADLPVEASGVSVASVFGQKVYAVCGATAKGPVTALYVYDPVIDRWSSGPAPPISGGARDCNVQAAGGVLYILGATRGDGAVDGNTYAFDPAEKEWRIVGAMPTPRGAAGVAVIGTRIYVAGGVDAGGKSSSALEVFETQTRSWTALPAMPTARDHLTAKAIRGMVYAIGGQSDRVLNTNEEYNPTTRAWRARAPMPTARSRLGSGKSNSRIQVFGGEGSCAPDGVCSQTEEFDPAANAWRALAALRAPRHSLSGATIDGRVFVAGGGPGFSSAFDALHLPSSTPPSILDDGVVNAASLQPGLAPGALASLFGGQLSHGEQQSLRAIPPTELNAVSVKLNGRAAPLLYVGPDQINFQVPLDLPTGPVEVTVTDAGLESTKASIPPVAAYAPAIFTYGGTGTGQGVVLIAGTALIAGGRKSPGFRLARRGEAVEIYCTGLASVASAPAVTIGGASAEVLSARMVSSLPGVYQVNVRIPAAATAGIAVPVVLSIGGAASNEVTIGVL
jgi:uncharacterized protein (TIGR03437 family)